MANTPKAINTDWLVADPRAINDLNQSVIKVPFKLSGRIHRAQAWRRRRKQPSHLRVARERTARNARFRY